LVRQVEPLSKCSPRQRGALAKRRQRRASSRARPLRRRRDGRAAQARTREQSPARVRVPARQKAPRSFRRRDLSRGRIQGGSRPAGKRLGFPDRGRSRAGDPGARDVTRRVRATSSRARASPSLERLGPRFVLPRKWIAARESRRKRIAARRPPSGQPDDGPTQPASVGAGVKRSESSTRVRGLAARSGVPARRLRLQKSTNDAEAQRSANPAGKRVAWTGAQVRTLRKDGPGFKSVVDPSRGGQAAAREGARAGRSKERCGAEVFGRWKAPRVVWLGRPFTRAAWGRSRQLLGASQPRERWRGPRRGDRGVRGLCMHASRREDNARHRRSREGSRAARRSEMP